MVKEIFPSLFLIRPEPKTPFTYLLKRPAGNILFATKADVAPMLPQIAKMGGVAHILLGDRHHAEPHTEALAKRLGIPLTCSSIEAAALKKQKIDVGRPLPFEPSAIAPDLEIIPTPGHTPGALSYLWTHADRRCLFVGDTIVPVEGAWRYWVTAPNRAKLRETLRALSALEFDVILSNSFAATPEAWLQLDPRHRAKIFAELDRSLSG